jgi:hypothetical protein
MHRANQQGNDQESEGTEMSGTIHDPAQPTARFVVLRDSPLTLAVGGDIDRDFDFTLYGVWSNQPVVISFLLVHADNLLLRVSMNDKSYEYRYSPGPQRTVHEVLQAAAHSGANRLTVTVLEGSCRFSDLIVWYQGYPAYEG